MKEELVAVLLAMSPLLEAHGSIAAAIGLFKFSFFKAYSLAVVGNLVVIVPLLFIWHYLTDFLMRHFYFLNRFFSWLFSYTKRKHAHHFENFGQLKTAEQARQDFWKTLALFVFMAIPGPLTGVWGSTVAAFIFGVPFWNSVLAIALGSLAVAFFDVLAIAGFFELLFN